MCASAARFCWPWGWFAKVAARKPSNGFTKTNSLQSINIWYTSISGSTSQYFNILAIPLFLGLSFASQVAGETFAESTGSDHRGSAPCRGWDALRSLGLHLGRIETSTKLCVLSLTHIFSYKASTPNIRTFKKRLLLFATWPNQPLSPLRHSALIVWRSGYRVLSHCGHCPTRIGSRCARGCCRGCRACSWQPKVGLFALEDFLGGLVCLGVVRFAMARAQDLFLFRTWGVFRREIGVVFKGAKRFLKRMTKGNDAIGILL